MYGRRGESDTADENKDNKDNKDKDKDNNYFSPVDPPNNAPRDFISRSSPHSDFNIIKSQRETPNRGKTD